jgi:hypothetical protein
MSRTLYLQVKSPWYPLDGRPGGPQNRSGYGGEEKYVYELHISIPSTLKSEKSGEPHSPYKLL